MSDILDFPMPNLSIADKEKLAEWIKSVGEGFIAASEANKALLDLSQNHETRIQSQGLQLERQDITIAAMDSCMMALEVRIGKLESFRSSQMYAGDE